jgi:hypothetical protein
MQGFLIWGTFTVGVAAFCVWRPQAARIFVGLFFGAMGLGIHGGLIATNPQSYVDFAAAAPWALYRDIGLWLTEPSPLVFGIFMLLFETVTAALILSRGRYVKWGLTGAILFLIGITPLGLEEVPNVILAAGIAFLLTQEFPTDVWTTLRRHLRDRRTTTAGAATAAPGSRPGPEITSEHSELPHRRSEGRPLPHRPVGSHERIGEGRKWSREVTMPTGQPHPNQYPPTEAR